MARLTPGYWAGNYHPTFYFADEFWPNFGTVLVTYVKNIYFKNTMVLKKTFKSGFKFQENFKNTITIIKEFKNQL